jgi:hypothetical protein
MLFLVPIKGENTLTLYFKFRRHEAQSSGRGNSGCNGGD